WLIWFGILIGRFRRGDTSICPKNKNSPLS
ncbi:hypothetical protein TSUD_388380, partial [Trifolium subterraneum]